jgi:hydroxymethylpyrimidine pyrophosphatase-like HAD family hydrolase
MELSACREVVRRGRELGVRIGWWVGEDWYVEAEDETTEIEVAATGVKPVLADLDRIESPAYKLQCMIPPDRIARLVELRDGLPAGLAGAFSNPNYLEVTAAGVDKAAGLARLGLALGVEPGEMAAIGDGENDLGMIRMVGLGVAMANARPSPLAAAAWVTSSNDEGGVAAAIARMAREGLLPPMH